MKGRHQRRALQGRQFTARGRTGERATGNPEEGTSTAASFQQALNSTLLPGARPLKLLSSEADDRPFMSRLLAPSCSHLWDTPFSLCSGCSLSLEGAPTAQAKGPQEASVPIPVPDSKFPQARAEPSVATDPPEPSTLPGSYVCSLQQIDK